MTRVGEKAIVRVGDCELGRETWLAYLRSYGANYPGTVKFYDLAGVPDGSPGPGGGADPVNEVTLADMGRLVVIGARLAPGDVAKLMDVHATQEFEAVPPTAQLEQCDPDGELYDAATVLYDAYRLGRGSNIGRAKRSKLLHLKRPWLVPIFDSRVELIYRGRARNSAMKLGHAASWELIRQDLCDGADDLAWLAQQVSEDSDADVRRLGQLTHLRLLDILAWTAAVTRR